jgi:glyoxylase-like metal-dependent hydrolase (beta-lactamase superfamily II)
MFEEILPGLFRIDIPLPNSPLKATNAYLIKGNNRALLIDTGMNREECQREMISNLEKLNIDMTKTDLFITHLHSDHLGLAGVLASSSSKIYFNQIESDLIRRPERWQEAFNHYLANGYPENELKKSIASHPGSLYNLKQSISFSILKEHDIVEIGIYNFECIETPGHSPGHMCLYEPEQKILISGDNVLFDITPNITYWPNMKNPLQKYLESLDKIYGLDVKIVLPGHRSIWNNHKTRIEEIRKHHEARINEVLSALINGPKNAFDIAPYITWSIKYDSWEEFPASQKWFAFGETLAHLQYLEEKGTIKRNVKEDKITYAVK